MEIVARRYDTCQPVRLGIEGGLISQVERMPDDDAEDLPWVSPGWIDLQVNGYGGQECSAADLTVDKVAAIARAMDRFGTTRFCPTVTTNAPEVMGHALRTIARACETVPEVARRVAGIHVEGPYLSREDGPRGAHPLAHCHEPDWDELQRFQEAAGGRIRILTLSPEYPAAPDFIRRVTEGGVLVSLGHTSATPDQIRAAADAGARMSTHLGNGCHAQLPRHRNYLWAQLADDRLAAGLICDGFHLPPDVVKCFVRAKGPEACVLVSDLSGMAGLAPGRYATNLCELEILPSGKVVIAGQHELLAGASAPLGQGIAGVMQYAGMSLPDAVHMATDNPARMLGIEPSRLDEGQPADLVLFRVERLSEDSSQWRVAVEGTVIGGDVVFGAAAG